MSARIGVVSTAGRDRVDGRRTHGADAYLVCDGGRTTWFEGGVERTSRGAGTGVLLAVADGDGVGPDAATASSSVCRVLAKLWAGGVARDPAAALGGFLASAHTRMYWKSRERGAQLGASCAVAWLVGDELAWAEVGTARVLLRRDGALRRLGGAWPENDAQRMLQGSRGLGDDTAVHLRTGRNLGLLPLRVGDQVVLTTDGLWDRLDETSAGHLLGHVDDAQLAAVGLMERAIARGAQDAVTVAVLDLRAGLPLPPPAQQHAPARMRDAVTEP